MNEFFLPLRRKIGIVTLILTAVLSMGWVRSVSRIDMVSMSVGKFRSILVSSNQRCRILFPGEETIDLFEVIPGGTGSTVQIRRILPDYFESKAFNAESAIGQVRIAETIDPQSQAKGLIRFVPYWTIVIPLMLVSAGLLLKSPRRRTTIATSTAGV